MYIYTYIHIYILVYTYIHIYTYTYLFGKECTWCHRGSTMKAIWKGALRLDTARPMKSQKSPPKEDCTLLGTAVVKK